jgi:hypothetical protein
MKPLKIGQEVTVFHIWRGACKLRVLDSWFDKIAGCIMQSCEVLDGAPWRCDSEREAHDIGDIITINPANLYRRNPHKKKE